MTGEHVTTYPNDHATSTQAEKRRITYFRGGMTLEGFSEPGFIAAIRRLLPRERLYLDATRDVVHVWGSKARTLARDLVSRFYIEIPHLTGEWEAHHFAKWTGTFGPPPKERRPIVGRGRKGGR